MDRVREQGGIWVTQILLVYVLRKVVIPHIKVGATEREWVWRADNEFDLTSVLDVYMPSGWDVHRKLAIAQVPSTSSPATLLGFIPGMHLFFFPEPNTYFPASFPFAHPIPSVWCASHLPPLLPKIFQGPIQMIFSLLSHTWFDLISPFSLWPNPKSFSDRLYCILYFEFQLFMLWRKGRREEKRKKGQMVQIDRQRGGQFKPNYSNNHFKCKNGLYRPIKRLSLSDWNIKAISNYIYCHKKALWI